MNEELVSHRLLRGEPELPLAGLAALEELARLHGGDPVRAAERRARVWRGR